MINSSKNRVAVLYGGCSKEREISLLSAKNVIENIDRSLFEVVPIEIDKKGVWHLNERILFDPNLIGTNQTLNKYPFKENEGCDRLFDVVFPMIHGPLSEDGTIQGLLELANLPYVGCGVLTSSIGMDKAFSKRFIENAGIPVAPFIILNRARWDRNPEYYIKQMTEQLSYPVFVKPANMGSSIGVSKVKNVTALSAAIWDAFQYDTKIIVEKYIDAIEIEVAILGSEYAFEEPFVSMVGEIRPSSQHEFYSYDSKYVDAKGADIIIPAAISSQLHEEAKSMAKKIFSVLEGEGMARIDLFVERGTNMLYFNEINTIPGFTHTSMYPKLMIASGIPYSELLTRLIHLAIERHKRKDQLIRC